MIKISAFIKNYRKQRNISQSKLAELSGFHQKGVSKFESNQIDVRLSTFEQLAQALDLKIVLVPRQQYSAVQQFIQSEQVQQEITKQELPSLLDQYGVPDDED